jgi:PEP-CTERM motif
MRKQQAWLASLAAAAALAGAMSALASPPPFTWNPAGASPALGGSAFTADTINETGYVRDVTQPDGTHLAQRFEVITGFSLNGAPVLPAGFGSSYGLYFEFTDQGIGGPPPHILNFTSISMALKADPGNHNGAVSSTVSGIGFANTGPTGQADDIVLATGSLVAGSLFLDTTTGILDGNTLLTFDPIAGQAAFFAGGSGLLEFDASNPASLLVMTPGPGGTTIANFNDYVGTAQFVPEPGSLALLGTGLLGLLSAGLLRRRSN